MYRLNYCEIDLNAVRHNMDVMRRYIAPGAKFMAVVKANAYGHGAAQVAWAALGHGADALAVAIPEEGEALRQAERFRTLCAAIAAVHPSPIVRHAANTASIFRYPEIHCDMVRAGIALYGCPPVPEVTDLAPVMRWVTQAVYVKTIAPGDRVSYGGIFEARRETRIMTVPVGYADGYRRGITGKGCVLVRGKRAPIVGRICMDQMMVDVTDVPGVMPGDEVVLLGSQGTECISAGEMAGWLNTIDYEVLCSPGERVPRVWMNF